MSENGELQFVRFTQPALFSLIPRYLFEQVAETDKTLIVENVYKYGPELITSPSTFFYGIISPKDNKIVGILWCMVNVLTNQLVGTYMSLDKEYQWQGILKQFKELAKLLCNTCGLSETYQLYTLYPGVAEKFGGKESKCKIYEFSTTESITNGIEGEK